MRFVRRFLNRLENQPEQHDTVVVVDVLRSFTTAAVALARGARAVHPVVGDLQVVSGADRYAFAMPVQRQGEQLLIRG